MPLGQPRDWGFWTRAKLEVLRDYLAAFLTASQSAPSAVYLDAFAGEGRGVDRLTSEEFDGSARIAAQAVAAGTSGYRFEHLRFFELKQRHAATIEAELRRDYPGRDIQVISGDCNRTLPATLAALPPSLRKAPTFAFLDPFGTELRWPTIRAVAKHKDGLKYKVEFWMLFNSAGMMRIAGSSPEKAALDWEERLDELFGNGTWGQIVQARRDGLISADNARAAFVNLMRWQLEQELGYVHTHALELKNARGAPIYHMIFATDHPVGDKIIRDLYARSAAALPGMAEEARQAHDGVFTLFPVAEPAPKYEHDPPVAPAELLKLMRERRGHG